METWEAICCRRNVRRFTDQPIPPEHLDRILEAGRRAPSSINWQPWDFVVVTDRRQLAELSAASPYGFPVASSQATIALIAPLPADEMRRDWIQYDFGQATMAMMLAAADMRIGSGHASVFDQRVTQAVLGLPVDRFCPYLLTFGYPADRPLRPMRRPNRRPFEEVVHRGRW